MREGWEYKRLGELCDIVMGQSPMGNSINENNGIEFHQGKTNFGDKFLMESGIYTTSPIRIAEKKTILLCVRAPVGIINITERQVCIGRGLSSLKPRLGLELLYLYYCLLSKQNYFESNSTGSTFKAISSKVINNTIIQFPPKPTQLSIVSELDKLNELIQIKKEQLKDYDTLAQSIFYEMFGDPVENEKGWEVKKLKDISRKIGDGLHGTPEYSELDTSWYFINGNNLENGCISIKSTTKKVTDFVRKKYYVEMDDFTLLVSINGTLGKSAFYNGENVILGKSACYIKLNKDVNKLFIYEIIRGEYFKRYAESVCTGTTIRNVSLKAMREFPIIYPPLPLQHSFAQKIEQIEQQKAAIQKTITDLETLLAARMQYWFD